MVLNRLLFILTVVLLVVAACTKPSLIGSDFLDDEKAGVAFKDDFDLIFHTVRTDSVIVHSDNVTNQLITYMVGNIQDPIFGNYTAELFAQPILTQSGDQLKNATLDSVVLQLRYDTLGNYGTFSEPVTLEVYRMTENPDFSDEVYSNERFDTDLTPLGSLTFIPRPKDSVTVMTPNGTSRVPPHVRIPLDIGPFMSLIQQASIDSNLLSNKDNFLEFFNGLHIKMTGSNNTMLGFNLLTAVSGLTLYYDNDPAFDREFKFFFTPGSMKTVYMEHDYTGTVVADAFSPEAESDYWFVQGLSGVTTTMEILDLSELGNVIINQAELEVYATVLPGDQPALYPPVNYLVTQEMTDTSTVNSVDVNLALVRANSNFMSPAYATLFGGVLQKVGSGSPAIYRYNMKVTAQVKDIFLGKKENIIYFNPFEKANVPNRSVMFGPGHPEFAPRLRIYYTEL